MHVSSTKSTVAVGGILFSPSVSAVENPSIKSRPEEWCSELGFLRVFGCRDVALPYDCLCHIRGVTLSTCHTQCDAAGIDYWCQGPYMSRKPLYSCVLPFFAWKTNNLFFVGGRVGGSIFGMSRYVNPPRRHTYLLI